MIEPKPWQHRRECKKCGDTIWSKFEGEFVTCKCGAISVDQNKYYERQIGHSYDFILEPSNKRYEETK